MEKIGLLAGKGNMPLIFTKRVKNKEIVAIAIEKITSPKLSSLVPKTYWIPLTQINKSLDILQKLEVYKMVLLGKLEKKLIFNKLPLNPLLQNLLDNLEDGRDSSFFKVFAEEAKRKKIEIISPVKYLQLLLVKKGPLTPFPLTKKQWEDIRLGWKVAKKIADMDIGQVVIVKNLTILAIEGIEGTNQTILRGGEWGGEGTVVVKVARPNQDMRFDIPVVGPETINIMAKVKSRVLALEVGKIFLMDKFKVIQMAKKNKISIIGVEVKDK